MWILPLLSYLGILLGFIFLTLSIASGLYYLSELVEEHTVLSKRLLTRLIYIILVLHVVLLVVDGFPVARTVFSAGSHVVYLMNITKRFPMVRLTDPIFMLSCVLVVSNHFLWFGYFSENVPAPPTYGGGTLGYHPEFSEIASFFGVCVWLVPFALFVSLSASDNVLPTVGEGGQKPEGLGKMMVGGAKAWIEGCAGAVGWGSGEGSLGRKDRLA